MFTFFKDESKVEHYGPQQLWLKKLIHTVFQKGLYSNKKNKKDFDKKVQIENLFGQDFIKD